MNNEDKVIKDMQESVHKILTDTTNNIKKTFISDEFLCTSYLIKYVETKDNNYYLKFTNLYEKLDNDKKIMVVYYFSTYCEKNKKEKQNVKERGEIK